MSQLDPNVETPMSSVVITTPPSPVAVPPGREPDAMCNHVCPLSVECSTPHEIVAVGSVNHEASSDSKICEASAGIVADGVCLRTFG